MSGPVEVPEVERMREQVRRLEEREAGLSTLLESYGQQIERLRADLDAELMERAAARVRARHDMLRFEALKRVAAEHFADVQRMRATVQQSNASVERMESEARRLRVGAIVQMAKPPPGRQPWRGVAVFVDADTERMAPSVLVWWIDPIKPADVLATPEWASRADLTVIG